MNPINRRLLEWEKLTFKGLADRRYKSDQAPRDSGFSLEDWQSHKHLNVPKGDEPYSEIEMSLINFIYNTPELYKVKSVPKDEPPKTNIMI